MADTDVKRYSQNRNLNLTNFLPSMSKETETQQFTQFFESFLNTLFDGINGMSISATDVTVTGEHRLSGAGDVHGDVSAVLVQYSYDHPVSATPVISTDTKSVEHTRILSATDTSNKMSIVEKVYRLSEVKDVDLIDIEYIQYFAENLGYNINVYRPEVGNVGESIGIYAERAQYSNSATSASDINAYLRFMVANLPNWYKIKTTDNAMKVMLYSFGLIGDIINYYTDSYIHTDDGGKWVQGSEENLALVPKEYFSTPHFAIRIFLDESDNSLIDALKRNSVIRAIESMQPINTVFRQLSGYVLRQMNLNAMAYTRLTRYMRITA